MKILTLITVCMISTISTANPLIGNWVSDEERTLEEVNKVKDMPNKSKEYFEDNFFGKLKIRFTDKKIYSIYEDSKNEGSYEVLDQTEESVTIKAWNETLNEYEEQVFYLDGTAIYTIVSKYKFREYFKKYNGSI